MKLTLDTNGLTVEREATDKKMYSTMTLFYRIAKQLREETGKHWYSRRNVTGRGSNRHRKLRDLSMLGLTDSDREFIVCGNINKYSVVLGYNDYAVYDACTDYNNGRLWLTNYVEDEN